MPSGICPECDSEVPVSPDVEIGDFVTCPECDTELEVVELDPLELDVVSEFEEDFTEEDEEEEEW